ncbi:MAG: hypothetical protein CMI54_06270 [Parcubacteria group bacterium]|jgi:hypothetical protein|nr:hypothetical protein [Parcubacteria group bacterium]|tara:strand:- start:14361 stop:15851 length:1491 start_codon:yes stop_codon:yes gene_type:complete
MPEATNNKPDPSYTLPEYDAMLPLWLQIQHCLEGEITIKTQDTTYLPMPNATDLSNENKARYAAYILRAVFYNFTSRTLNGLVGMVFQKDPQIDIPPSLKTLETDVDGSGVSLLQQSQKTLAAVVSKGRSALFVDFPKTEGDLTQEVINEGGIHPVIIRIAPEQIINWRTVARGSKTVLSLVDILESYVVSDNGFEECLAKQWRVLKLVDNVYTVEIWQEQEGNDSEKVLIETTVPTDHKGKPLDFIPLTFVGSTNNDPNIDQPPLYDMSVLNIAHYRNSADYEEACFVMGQPTPYFTGLTEHWVKEVLQGEIQLGARAAVSLPEDADAGMLQVEPNTMPKEAMDAKEKQALSLGAKLVEVERVQRTAEEASSDNASDSSVLGTAANNVSEAYEVALRYAGAFVGITEDATVKLNTDFDSLKISPQEFAQIMAAWNASAITDMEMRAKLIDSGYAFEEFEDWETFKDENLDTQMLMLGEPPVDEGSSADEEETEDN